MWRRGGWLLLIFVLVNVTIILCRKSSSSSVSRPSYRPSSRPSHPNPVHLSYPSSHSSSSNQHRHATTRRPVTHRHVYHTNPPPTRRITTRRTTRPPITTYRTTRRRTRPVVPQTYPPPTRRSTTTTRQPAYNPYFTTTRTTKQPAFNPYFTTPRSNGRLNITRQPPFNPYFTTAKPIGPPSRISQVGSGTGTRQPIGFVTPPSTNRTGSFGNSKVNITGRPVGIIPPPKHTDPLGNFNSGPGTSRPIGFVTPPLNNRTGSFGNSKVNITGRPIGIITPPKHTDPLGNYNRGNGPSRPIGIIPPPKYTDPLGNSNKVNGTKRPIGILPPGPQVGPPKYDDSVRNSSYGNGRPLGFTPTPPKFTIPSRNTTRFQPGPNTSYNNNIWGIKQQTVNPISATQPGYNPRLNMSRPSGQHPSGGGYYRPGGGYYQPVAGHYQPGGGLYHPGVGHSQPASGVTIINNNFNNQRVVYPTHSYAGYGPPATGVTIVNNNWDNHYTHYPSYHYTTHDTGSTTLGFFLGYSLGRLTRPSYSYHNVYYNGNEYVPRYDHYTVHHYYHSRESVPKEAKVDPNAIVLCAGDTGMFCPQNTTALCTNNGAVMCVASAARTSPCRDDWKTNCVTSTVQCVSNSSPECKQTNLNYTSIGIPCISSAEIYGSLAYVNNSIVVTDANNATLNNFCVTVLAIPAAKSNTTEQISLPYRYTTNDTGISILGFYLAQQLEQLLFPSFNYLNYDKEHRYVEKYDHYSVYHYFHGRNIMPNETEVAPETIIPCAGDSGIFCPSNTTALCFSDGGVLCITNVSSTVFCKETGRQNCVQTTISCINNKAPDCKMSSQSSLRVAMPCISTAKINSSVIYVNSSITSSNGLVKHYLTLQVNKNATVENSTLTTTPSPVPTYPSILSNKTKVEQFCVVIIALPAEKVQRQEAAKKDLKALVTNAKHYQALPDYRYLTAETGTKTLGHYLAHRLGKLRYPSYYFLNNYYNEQNVIQKYDHYTVYHYFKNNSNTFPKEIELRWDSIIPCAGDSGTFCPPDTSSMCLNNGNVMCVTDILSTVNCKTSNGTCTETELSCENLKAPKCKANTKAIGVRMTCISTATVYGSLISVNNSVLLPKNVRQYYTDIQAAPYNSIDDDLTKENAQMFCVAIAAVPTERKISRGEMFFGQYKQAVGNFVVKMLGIS